MYACGGEGIGGCRNVYRCGSLVATYETKCCRREAANGNANQGVVYAWF